jgi:hypothetical protein
MSAYRTGVCAHEDFFLSNTLDFDPFIIANKPQLGFQFSALSRQFRNACYFMPISARI